MIGKDTLASAAEDCADSRNEMAARNRPVDNEPGAFGTQGRSQVRCLQLNIKPGSQEKTLMRDRWGLKYSFDLIFVALSVMALLAVMQTFIIGRHYIIPSVILVVAVVLGNIAWYGLQDQRWAKLMLFWSAVLFTCHAFFALFWSKAYRDVLGAAFEWVCGVVVISFVFLLVEYVRRNRLFT